MVHSIRAAAESDLPAVLELWRAADALPSHTDDLNGLGTLLARDPGSLLVAEEDGQLTGSVIAGWDGWRGTIYRLAVLPSARRTGLGRRLVAEAERRLDAVGARRCHAIVVETDATALGFWQASGWQRQSGQCRFVRG